MQPDPLSTRPTRPPAKAGATGSGTGSARPDTQLRGSNQSGMRARNERLILTLIRTAGALPKAELARRTGLSAQATSVIVRALQADGLLVPGIPIRGRVGQPSVPMTINPQGACFLGLHVGRRRVKLVLLDFAGDMLQLWQEDYPYPEPDNLLEFVSRRTSELPALLGSELMERIAGLGVAIPFGLWHWADQAGAPADIQQAWKQCDFAADLQQRVPWMVMLENDATAACNAEMIFGTASSELHDFLYLYIDTFIGGGIVLDKRLFPGHSGNAGAIGSMLVPDSQGRTRQLIGIASLTVLEEQLRAAGCDSSRVWNTPSDWSDIAAQLRPWQAEASSAIAHAIINACAVLDLNRVVLDGVVPADVRSTLRDDIEAALRATCSEGLVLPELICGTTGEDASVLGAAGLVLANRFLTDYQALTRATIP